MRRISKLGVEAARTPEGRAAQRAAWTPERRAAMSRRVRRAYEAARILDAAAKERAER